MRALFVVRNLAAAEPLGVMQLGALLRRAGHQVCLAGARETELAPLIDSFAPDLVGYSACTGEHRRLLDLNRRLKRGRRFTAVFGGPHATFFPEMVGEEGVDAVCRGEGEGAILDVAEAIDVGRPLGDIANLWVRTERGVTRNDLRPLAADLDALPFPDRELRYAADPASRGYPVKSFLASRGCPFRCTYCFNNGYAALYGPEWCRPRTRSVGNLLAEIAQVRRESRLEFVQFRESIFPWQPGWLAEFAERYPREVGLPFYCHVRADLLDARRVELLARAGCVSVNMGIECGDEAYRREALGRNMSDGQIVEACRLLHERGIRILADNMIALPGAPAGADWKTLRLNRRCRVDYALAMIFQPYPGTELGRRAEELGLFDGKPERIDGNYYLRSPLAFPDAGEQRQAENLQKFFALLAEAPWLEGLVRPLLGRAPNIVFLSIFRAWYIWCYTFRIVPHRLDLREVRELLRTLFGIYSREANRETAQENREPGGPDRGRPVGRRRGDLHRRLRLEGESEASA